jgi:hypothetical protein
MTTAVLIGGPLFLVLGALYWVLSFSKEQGEFNAAHWKRHGAKV